MMRGSGIANSARLMALATVVSRGLGFAKSILLVAAVGGTSAAVGGQTFDVANSAPTYLYGLIAGGVLGAVLVPQIVRATATGADGKAVLERLLTLTLLGATAVTLLLTLGAPLIVRIYASGWSAEWLALATAMAYWAMPQILFFILFTVLAQLLNASGRFQAAAWAPALSNVVAIAGLVVFILFTTGGLGPPSSWDAGMIALLCGTATLGIVLQGVILLIPVRMLGLRLRPRLGISGLGGTGRIAGWTFGALIGGQLAYIAVSNVAAVAGERLNASEIDGASLNSLSYAYLLLLLPHGILTVSLATAMFTRMSESATKMRFHEVRENLQRTSSFVSFVSLAATAIFIVLGPSITEILWGTPIIGEVLRVLSLGLIGFSQAYVNNRALFALQRGREPFINQAVAAVLTGLGAAAVGTWVPPEYVVEALALVIAVANTVSWVLAARSVKGILSVVEPVKTLSPKRGLLVNLASLVTAVALGFLAQVLLPFGASTLALIGTTAIVGSVMMLAYAGVAFALGDPNLRAMFTIRNR